MKVIAHRGASGEFPENSLLAFEHAIKQQADGIELDAQYHLASGKFVLVHDHYVTNNAGETFSLNDLSLAALSSISKDKQTITTLDQALMNINGRCSVNIELKVTTDDKITLQTIVTKLQKLLAEFIERQQFTYSQFVISTFNHPLLISIKQHIPQVDTAALIAHIPLSFDEYLQKLQVTSINPSIACLNQELVDKIHQHGFSVWVYTVDRKQDVLRCLHLGVDAIFTNYPARTQLIITESIHD